MAWKWSERLGRRGGGVRVHPAHPYSSYLLHTSGLNVSRGPFHSLFLYSDPASYSVTLLPDGSGHFHTFSPIIPQTCPQPS